MPRYNVLITRDCTESVELPIDADTPEAAVAAALEEARNSLALDWVADDNGNVGDPYHAGEIADVEILDQDGAT